ncbi:MAG: phosphorylase [Leptolyngbyaceae cyanobacterium MAG.088]|nr:phosphorylase [Leptolyngbyaceae cyanobacterium MAG.088]
MCDRADSRKPWQPGSLWSKLQAQTQHGLATGALKPIDTEYEIVSDGSVEFTVRILTNLNRKAQARKVQNKKKTNPFLPYDPNLYVTDISDTHVCLLNKFNVVDQHFLIVTREFESQLNWLTLNDFEALCRCLNEVPGLFFYNAGTAAGASQPHKHLQLVPQQSMELPIEIAIEATNFIDGIGQSPHLPYAHRIVQLRSDDGAQQWLQHYRRLLHNLDIDDPTEQWHGCQREAYNLLGTRNWLMAVPRHQDDYLGISVNSLGFAGSLLVKNQEQLHQLKEIGPMALLKEVGNAII